ncbi:hypothetical protein [Ideonella sp. BN130291]|uniref:hypothetical protein n=1 Tax=Ideonella sp. BN130291 TaxID=3112940 RepID=UPI002E266B33|nr:hypothetical protein [Ideonella sp. BN130291]
MLSLLLPRPTRRDFAPPPSTRMRLEVCPPALLSEPEPAYRRALRWLAPPQQPAGDTGTQQLQTVREEFAQALDDIGSQHAEFLQHRIRHIRSMRELWHARSEMYGLIATRHTQAEAERRMAALNRHFPTRSPRSGFVPLD